jgi:small conductance mechanosensitive channel
MQPVKAPPIKQPADTIVAKLHIWVNDFFIQIPNLVAAIAFLVVAWLVAKGVAWLIRRYADRRGRLDLGSLLASVAYGTVLIVALMVAAAIVFPSVKPADILATLGVGSVAVGFAFKDILQNLFAGLLLLTNRPFRRGDQIIVKDFEGTVEHIESRATLLKTYDGKRVIIPNADIYTSPVVVNTAFPVRRDQFDIGIGYGDEPARAATLIREALAGVEGVVDEPAPEVLVWGLDESSVTLRARWWCDSHRTNVVHTRARAVLAIHEVCVANGIDLPFPTRTILFHDQTEDGDGDRAREREGWPARGDAATPEGIDNR